MAKAQDEEKVYLNEVLASTSRKAARYFRVVEGQADGLFIGRTYTMEGILKSEGTYMDQEMRVEHGFFIFYHANGNVESRGEYVTGKKTGIWERYDNVGKPFAEKVYSPAALENILYTRAETMPVSPQDSERALVRYIKDHVVPPGGKRIKGNVMTSFVVEKDGRLSDVKVVQGVHPDVDAQVVQALKENTLWKPGTEKGIPVRVVLQVPVDF
jgi:TonB family protein